MSCMTIIWVSNSFGYYLISYQLKYIKGDMYLNGMVSSLSELAADILSIVFISRIGIKMIFQLSFFTSFLGMLSFLIYPGDDRYVLAFFVLGTKFGISCAFNTAYCGNNLVFPVTIVSTSYGICNMFARLSTIGAPYVAEIDPEWIPKAGFCALIATAFVASCALRTDEDEKKDNKKGIEN